MAVITNLPFSRWDLTSMQSRPLVLVKGGGSEAITFLFLTSRDDLDVVDVVLVSMVCNSDEIENKSSSS